MEDISIARGRVKPRKTIAKTVKKDLDLIGLSYDKILSLFDLYSLRSHLMGQDIVVVIICHINSYISLS